MLLVDGNCLVRRDRYMNGSVDYNGGYFDIGFWSYFLNKVI